MQINKMKRLLLGAVVLASTNILWAQSPEVIKRVDSCRAVAATQSGLERLQTLDKMQLLTGYSGKELELSTAQELEDEATRQGNTKMIGIAKYRKVCVWAIHQEIDKCIEEAGREMEACLKLGEMDTYYRLVNFKGEKILFQGNTLKALEFITPLMESASKANNTYGMAACSDVFGQIYTAMGDNAQAERYLLEAIEQYKRLGGEGTNGLMDAYFKLCNVYFTAKKYAQAIRLTHDYEKRIIDAEKAATENVNIPGRYGLCYFLRGVAAYHQGNNPQEVIDCYKKMVHYTDNGRILGFMIPTLEMYSIAAQGDYPKAIELADKQIAMYTEAGTEVGTLTYMNDKAKFLEAMGQYKEANVLLNEYMLKVEKIQNDQSLEQQNQFAALYELDKKEARAKLMQSWLIGAAVCCALLVLLAGLVIYHNQRLRQKNHALYLQYQKQKQAEERMDKMLEQQSAEIATNKDMQLFIEIKKLLQSKELLSAPSLDRNTLAEKLNTNYTYISNAVQAGADMSVKKYINQVRIDYACELLKEKDKYTIAEVQDRCGFQSRSAFNHAFKDALQMTPSDFLKESGR